MIAQKRAEVNSQAARITQDWTNQVRAQNAQDAAYQKRLDEERLQLQERLNEEHRVQFERYIKQYDTDGDGVINRDELRHLLTDLKPNHGEPSDSVIDMLLLSSGTTTLPTSMLKSAISTYLSYLSEKKELEDFWGAIDKDGSGTLTQDELHSYLSDIGQQFRFGPYVPVAGDIDFFYGACRTERGMEITGTALLLLRPAVCEWKRLIDRRLYEQTVAANQAKKSARCCLLM